MKRTRIFGMCLGVVLAFGAQAVTSAQASEYGRCLKVKKVDHRLTGGYEDAGCTVPSATGEGAYEWYAWGTGPQPQKATYKATGTTVVLRTALGEVTCGGVKGNTGAGEISAPTVGPAELTLRSCQATRREGGKLAGEECESVTEPYGFEQITLGLETALSESGENVWTEYHAEPATLISCGPGPGYMLKLRGILSGVTTGDVNAMSKQSVTTFSDTVGYQGLDAETSENKGKTWEGPSPVTLEGSFTAKYREKVEIKD